MASDKRASRRRYSEEIKARVMTECDAAGASVAKVAMSHGINANIVHRWRRGTTTMTITWPVSAAAEFAAWMHELLR